MSFSGLEDSTHIFEKAGYGVVNEADREDAFA